MLLVSLCYKPSHPLKSSCIVSPGNIGSELTESDISMFISSDAGNTWRQVNIIVTYVVCNKQFSSADPVNDKNSAGQVMAVTSSR